MVTLTTDFGLDDAFVGIMKGVLLGRAPDARIVDLTHAIPPGDVKRAAWTLHTAWAHFPPGTVHMVVVDPGVGSSRRILAARAEGAVFLAPDSGIIPASLDPFGEGSLEVEYRTVDAPGLGLTGVSRTFHGRDVFAPVAAALASGLDFATLGPPARDPAIIVFPRPLKREGDVHGEILHVDRFGNLITNVREEDLPPGDWRVVIEGVEVSGPAGAYSEAPAGGLLGIVGSAGFLEIAVRDGSAKSALASGVGTTMFVRPARPD